MSSPLTRLLLTLLIAILIPAFSIADEEKKEVPPSQLELATERVIVFKDVPVHARNAFGSENWGSTSSV